MNDTDWAAPTRVSASRHSVCRFHNSDSLPFLDDHPIFRKEIHHCPSRHYYYMKYVRNFSSISHYLLQCQGRALITARQSVGKSQLPQHEKYLSELQSQFSTRPPLPVIIHNICLEPLFYNKFSVFLSSHMKTKNDDKLWQNVWIQLNWLQQR